MTISEYTDLSFKGSEPSNEKSNDLFDHFLRQFGKIRKESEQLEKTPNEPERHQPKIDCDDNRRRFEEALDSLGLNVDDYMSVCFTINFRSVCFIYHSLYYCFISKW